jgi:protein-glutamine gamma-glutamyltransferase
MGKGGQVIVIIAAGKYVETLPFHLSSKQKEIFRYLKDSSEVHVYDQIRQLLFELILREHLINSAIALSESEVEFTIFQASKFNPRYWTKTPRGYLLRPDVLPSNAINDIFQNGKEYSFECTTAIVVLFYYAVLQAIEEIAFNRLFSHLLVWDWSYDDDLGVVTKVGTDFIPGDILYFYNPDYDNAVWIGENVVFLGDKKYFGHGIGIGTAKEMIEALNTLRKKNATRSAHLIHQYSRLNFRYLSQFSKRL